MFIFIVVLLFLLYNIAYIGNGGSDLLLGLIGILFTSIPMVAIYFNKKMLNVSPVKSVKRAIKWAIKPIPVFIIECLLFVFILSTQYVYSDYGQLDKAYVNLISSNSEGDFFTRNSWITPRVIKEILVNTDKWCTEIATEAEGYDLQNDDEERLSELRSKMEEKRVQIESEANRILADGYTFGIAVTILMFIPALKNIVSAIARLVVRRVHKVFQ